MTNNTNTQERAATQLMMKWMVNLGIPILIALVGWGVNKMDSFQREIAQNSKDIAVITERLDNLEGKKKEKKFDKEMSQFIPQRIVLEAILPKEEHTTILFEKELVN